MLVREGLSCCLPSALEAVVQGYCEPSEEDIWDEVVGVPLGDMMRQVLDLCTENGWLREENRRLQDQAARLQAEVERLKEADTGRKRALDGGQGGAGLSTDDARGLGSDGVP